MPPVLSSPLKSDEQRKSPHPNVGYRLLGRHKSRSMRYCITTALCDLNVGEDGRLLRKLLG